MTKLEQLKENIRTFSAPGALPGCLSAEDRRILMSAKAAYRSRAAIPCTGCEYCLPCERGVDIPGIFDLYNDCRMFGSFDNARRGYMFTKRGGEDQTRCVACGAWLRKCPQGIDIVWQLKIAHEALDGWVDP